MGDDPVTVTDLPAIEEDLVQRLAVALASEFFHSVLFHDGEVKAAPNTVAIARRLVDAVVRPLLEENERLWGENDAMAVWTAHAEAEIAGLRTEVEALRAGVGVGYRKIGWLTGHAGFHTEEHHHKWRDTAIHIGCIEIYVKEDQGADTEGRIGGPGDSPIAPDAIVIEQTLEGPSEFFTDMGRGMRRVEPAERVEFDQTTTDGLIARLDEFDRCRAEGERGLRALLPKEDQTP